MRFFFGLAALAFTGLLGAAHPAQAQKTRSVPFSYLPEQGEDRYNQRVPRKTLALPDGSGFIILAHQSGSAYAVERYDADLKKQWSTTLPVAPGETVEAFGRGPEQAWVVIHHADESTQNLTVQPFALSGGQKGAPVVVVTAPARDRRPGVRLSPDGTRLLAFRYLAREEQVKALEGTLYDQKLNKLLDRTYDFRDQGDFFSPNVLLANDGTQYVTLLGDAMKKLSARRYPPTPDRVGIATAIPVMGVPVGGTFGGQPITIRDARFSLEPDGQLYAVALCANDRTGDLSGLKVVRFDFAESRLKLAEELPFAPAFLTEVSKATGAPVKNMADIYLADMLLTDSKNLVVVAERHFEEGGPELPVHAREIYLFGYSPFLTPTWHTIVAKDQVAPAIDSYTGIGYRAAAFGEEVQLLTLETIGGKSDLYLRRVQAPTGVLSAPQRLKLNVANDQQLAYVKDFTAWLGPKTIIGVSRPSKKSAALQLNEVKFK
ncbi:hypothetical protein [Hymenobacter baengnokdamensis]|uniref:hypothetical protein n=1 Tax=Hymenobacter baengnokdamensis TaxID=2615203 RepID=UPI001248A86E|nr:hypothetical protein [Hymenobacter baengnokdamensis]